MSTLGIWALLIISFLFGGYAQIKLRSTYAQNSKIRASNGMTGRTMARYMLDSKGLQDVQIVPIKGDLTDHYDPRTRTVNLSQGVYDSPSIAAVGIAAHECGHAIQHATGYSWLNLRNTVIPLTNVGSQMAMPLILIGMLFSRPSLVTIGIIAYSLLALFQLITLPVEFNASSRALKVIDEGGILQGQEYKGAKATLSAAAMTYVAALMSALSQLLYLVTMLGGRRRNDR